MKVNVVPMGLIAKELGCALFSLDLPEGATLEDFYQAFAKEAAGKLPNSLWVEHECRFRGPVLLMSNDKVLRDRSEQLHEGQEIKIFKVVVGG